jgi:hypothetical protein
MSTMSINWNVILPIIIIQLLLMIVALIDLTKIERTRGPKLLWVFIIVLGSLLGSVAYFVVGRRNN